MTTIRTLVVEGEPRERQRLAMFLRSEPGVELIGAWADLSQAPDALASSDAHLLFVHASASGVASLAHRTGGRPPFIVLLSSSESDAARAFDLSALDCLLKPVDQERVRRTLSRARERLAETESAELARRMLAFASTLPDRQASAADRVAVKSRGRVVFLRPGEIDWIEAAGNYVTLHVGSRAHLIRQTMTGIEARLDPALFLRIHRSRIVNIDRIKEVEPSENGEYQVVLRDGARLTLSRGYRSRLRERLGRAL